MASRILYESEYKKNDHFSFGKNWQDYLKLLNPKRVKIAEESLKSFLDLNDLQGKTFIDIGCGSSVFSLAAHRLKAPKVVSVDVDESSLMCAQLLKKKEKSPKNWEIREGSVLNRTFLKHQGQFDIVYSWGVLHHTGDMNQAIRNITSLVKPNGTLFISIYNDYQGFIHGNSIFWSRIKQRYNQSRPRIKKLYFNLYAAYLFLGLCLSLKNPFSYIRNYQTVRGMSWNHDILDWLGGYPYEYATPEKIVSFLSDLGFTLKKVQVVNSIGCNEYVFSRNKPVNALPQVTVLMAAHNSADTLNRALESILGQTLQPNVVCVNDASTDTTAVILNHWKKKMGKKLEVVVNKENLGLTKSLNKGIDLISTAYTARIDADDWWEPTKLEKQINFLEQNPDYGVIGCWYINHRNGKTYPHQPFMRNEEIRQIMIKQNPFAHSCVVFKTQLIRELGKYDNKVRYGQDYELWLRCLPKTKFFNFPQYLCHRSFDGGISIEKQREQMRYAMQTRLKYIRKYRLSLLSYSSLIEPFIISLTPRWIADLKRRLNDRKA